MIRSVTRDWLGGGGATEPEEDLEEGHAQVEDVDRAVGPERDVDAPGQRADPDVLRVVDDEARRPLEAVEDHADRTGAAADLGLLALLGRPLGAVLRPPRERRQREARG